ncbi:EhaG family protein [Methanocaldococcus indicus]|uniref:EhaG family protein n=1 Tax=Methanocaldococcus indicus TaxID=213231 RepID=UPI003C6D508D
MYSLVVAVGFIVGILSLLAIGFQKNNLHALILTDLVECSLLVIIAALGTDLAEALILPGLVVSMAELLAISEVLIVREKVRGKKLEDFKINFELEILKTSPTFIAIILVVYGAILTGFTGGAVISTGLLYYFFAKRVLGENIIERVRWVGICGYSGIAWCLWIVGFLGFFLFPKYWLVFLLFSGLGLVIKVCSKLGLLGMAE